MTLALEAALREVVNPLLRADGARAELVSHNDAVVLIRVHGNAANGPGAEFIQQDVIIPVVRKVLGDDVEVKFEKAFPRITKRGIDKS